MKILMIDPWGVNGLEKYTQGLCSVLEKQEEVAHIILITNYYSPVKTKMVKTWFFRYSQKMKRGKARKIIRGLEYLLAYIRIYSFVRKNGPDIIHIQWLLYNRFDAFMLVFLKKHCSKLIFTAHNARPHVKGREKLANLKKVYDKIDKIVVHGKSVKNEIKQTFGISSEKIVIQRHGTRKVDPVPNLATGIPEQEKLLPLIRGKKKVFLCMGNMFYNKGVDRLVDIWLENDFSDCLLILAGRKTPKYFELFEREKKIKKQPNILFMDHFISKDLHDFFLRESDILLVLYRRATVSGVVFTAAEFKKPVLCTDVGSLGEYVQDGETGFIVENKKERIREELLKIKDFPKEELKKMGEKNFVFINKEFKWDQIGKKLVKEAYLP